MYCIRCKLYYNKKIKIVKGDEHHEFRCPSCGDEEHYLDKKTGTIKHYIFNKK